MKFVFACSWALLLVFSTGLQADVASGRSTYAAKGCIGCHGANGVSNVSTYPSLKGKKSAAIRKSLTEFRSGARKNPIMNTMAAGLNDADIRNLADYIDSLK